MNSGFVEHLAPEIRFELVVRMLVNFALLAVRQEVHTQIVSTKRQHFKTNYSHTDLLLCDFTINCTQVFCTFFVQLTQAVPIYAGFSDPRIIVRFGR